MPGDGRAGGAVTPWPPARAPAPAGAEEAKRDPRDAQFILRAARGFWAHRRYGAAVAQLLRALARHPAVAAHLLQGKMRRLGGSLNLRNSN